MIPSGARVWIAMGHTDMRKGMQGLALLVQQGLKRDPHGGEAYHQGLFQLPLNTRFGQWFRRDKSRGSRRQADSSSGNGYAGQPQQIPSHHAR